MNRELPDVEAGFRKGRGTRDQIANIRWIIEIAREFQKNVYFCFIDYAKAFDCVDHSKLGGILARKSIGCRDVQRKLQTELQTLEAETEVTLVVPIVQKITGSG